MNCNFCHKEYEREAQVITLFGSTFCLHDAALKHYRLVQGSGFKNDSVTAKVVNDGRTRAEQKYIDDSKKDGDFVVRSSDGLLRRMSDKPETEIE